jgi:hypothetical protein
MEEWGEKGCEVRGMVERRFARVAWRPDEQGYTHKEGKTGLLSKEREGG